MSFNEKLQNLRKENKMSQEQLADMLDVTRQSVSKWESGQTYPEMDKLIALSKIFKCSLDELTNDEIINISEKKKLNLIDTTLELIKKTFEMFKAFTFKQTVNCIFIMFLIALGLLLLRIPFDGIKDAVHNIINVLANDKLTEFISQIFNLLVNICYYILYILIFVYIFKIAYLDNYEITSKEEKNEKIETKNHPIFNTLGVIVLVCIKIMICFFSLPLVFSLLLLCTSFIVNIALIFKGIFYLGIFLMISFLILLNILILELIINFLFNRKNNSKKFLITFLIALVGIGLSFGIFMIEISKINYINKVPNEKIEEVTKEIKMTDKLSFENNFYHTEYIVDNNLTDVIVVNIKYYKEYYQGNIYEYDNFVSINGYSKNNKKYLELILKNLKSNKFYNYGELQNIKVNVYGNEENLNKLKHNYLYEEQNSEDYLEERNDQLEQENEELKSQIEEYKNNIREYKQNLETIID